MSILKAQIYISPSVVQCYEIDEFANDGTGESYPIDCDLLPLLSTRVPTLPNVDWITSALSVYFYYLLEQENQSLADALQIELFEYLQLNPDRDPAGYVVGDLCNQYITDNWPLTEDTQAFVDFIRSLELGI